MSPFELRSLRKAIGADKDRMADLLGLDSKSEVTLLEAGTEQIPKSVQRLSTYMQQGQSMGDLMDKVLPVYLFCTDIQESLPYEYIIRTRYPRFIAAVVEEPVEQAVTSTLAYPEYVCISMWIDEPVTDNWQTFADEAATYLKELSEKAIKDL